MLKFSQVNRHISREVEMLLIEEDCSLCGVTYPYYSLYRCYRCGRLYCRNCFLYAEDGKVICLRCARRSISPKGQRSKYTFLSMFLAKRAKYSDHVTLGFAEIEEIIGERLPFSAYHYKHWWSNIRNRSPSEDWLTVGWSVQNLDLEKKEVTFRRDERPFIKASENRRKRRRKAAVSASFKGLATKAKLRKRLSPSRSKIAVAQARIKNIERRRSIREYRGKFKPKRAYEKRLYKPEEKPDKAS